MAGIGASRPFPFVLAKVPLGTESGLNACFAILDALGEGGHRAIAAIGGSGIVRCVLAGGTRRVLGHQSRMLGEVDKLIGGNARGIGYLEPAAY
jgi:hypothetical protein